MRSIADGLPADRSELDPGDLVVAVDGIAVKPIGPMAAEVLIARHAPGELVRIEVERRGTTKLIEIPVVALTE